MESSPSRNGHAGYSIGNRLTSSSRFNAEAAADLKKILASLPEKYREAIELAELRNMSQKQLSKHLGISYTGAKSRVQRGREMIKSMMTSCCAIESDRYGNIIDYRVLLDHPVHSGKRK